MTNKPIVSIIQPSIRPQMWLMMYQSLLMNKTSFEMVSVGHIKPNFDLPASNIRYIYSEETPNRCCHIAIQHSLGEYILQGADDFTYSKNCLDILLSKYDHKRLPFINVEFITVTPETGVIRSIRKCSADDIKFFGTSINSEFDPVLPPAGYLFSKSYYLQLGGFDDRLTYRCGVWDFAMRHYEAGGEFELCSDALVRELRFGRRQKGSILSFSLDEEVLFLSLWCKYKNRSDRFSPNNLADIQSWDELKNFKKRAKTHKDVEVLRTRSDSCRKIGDMNV